ncbi:MAG TPA: peptidylprolyl isomerase [Gemmatimonadaceae bacterium]|nr:peptidylprolyl isomerase [Gemmatimonadaceae bacterium]
MALQRPFLLATLLAIACGKESQRQAPAGPAPDTFRVAVHTSKGRFVIEGIRAWAPNGADRFYALARDGFYDGNRFFRVLPGYVAQWGISGDREANQRWEKRLLPDDSVRQRNVRGTIVFTSSGPNTRAHQVFVNLKDSPRLDEDGFAPFGRVVEGMAVLDSLYDDYGDIPKQNMIRTFGNDYLRREFPRLDWIDSARVVPRP